MLTSSFQGIRWIFVACFWRLMCPGVSVCACMCVCRCVCSLLCQFTLKSCQPPPTVCNPPLSSPSVSSSSHLSPMNRLNFLMSCFYGLLMLIHSSPYARSLHSSVFLCLPWLIHSSSSSLNSFLGSLSATIMLVSVEDIHNGHLCIEHTVCSWKAIQRIHILFVYAVVGQKFHVISSLSLRKKLLLHICSKLLRSCEFLQVFLPIESN